MTNIYSDYSKQDSPRDQIKDLVTTLEVTNVPQTKSELCGFFLFFFLTKTVGAVDGEAHENDISVWIGEWAESVIVLLTCCVPER